MPQAQSLAKVWEVIALARRGDHTHVTLGTRAKDAVDGVSCVWSEDDYTQEFKCGDQE